MDSIPVTINASGCYFYSSIRAVILPLPEASLSYGQAAYCGRGIAAPLITGTKPGIFSAETGLVIDDKNGLINLGLSAPGQYNVVYAFKDSLSGCRNTSFVAVKVQPLPVVRSSDQTVCQPATVDLSSPVVTMGSSTGIQFSYFVDSATTQVLPFPQAISNAGIYFIKGIDTVTGCYAAVPVKVIVKPGASLQINQPAAVCAPAVINLTSPDVINGSSNGLDYRYFTAPDTLTRLLRPDSITTSGTYYIRASAVNGCNSIGAVNALVHPKPSFTVNAPSPVCFPSSIDLTSSSLVTSGNNLTLRYYTDSAGSQALAVPQTVNQTGIYYIQAEATTGCRSLLYPVNAIINARPAIITTDSVTTCFGKPVTLVANCQTASPKWVITGQADSLVVNPAQTTAYTVIASNAVGCADTASTIVKVNRLSVSLVATPDPVLLGSTVLLQATSSQAFEAYAWKPASFFPHPSSLQQSLTVLDSSRHFSFIGKSPEGCFDTAYLTIRVESDGRDLFIPNAFTPNNDGRNDQFLVYGSSIKELHYTIFNQWGQLLFESYRQAEGWNGMFRGKQQPAGIYLLKIKLQLFNGQQLERQSTINLIR